MGRRISKTIWLALATIISSLSTPAFSAETISVPRIPPNGGMPMRHFNVYTVQEIDAKLNSINQTVSSTVSSITASQNNLINQVASDSSKFQDYIKNEVATALNAVPHKVFSEDVKSQLASDIASRISGQLETELAKMKADLKNELLEAIGQSQKTP